MKFNASRKYELIARSPEKTLTWNLYVRKIEHLSGSLDSGTWTDVTSKVSDIPDTTSRIEYQLGQFTADSIAFEGHDITWWKNNIFNATEQELLEFKQVVILGRGTDVASEVVTVFSGFIDKVGIVYNERADSVTMNVYTVQDLGSRIAAENVSTQYVETDVEGDGTDTQGLFLFDIPSVYVTDANISGFPLKVGVHTITHEYDATEAIRRLRLDDGDWVTITTYSEYYTLTNVIEDEREADEKVEVYVGPASEMELIETSQEESIIVLNEGDTLPKQWYRNVGLRFLLKTILNTLGITDISFDTLEIDVAPAPAPGVAKVSFIDNPPNDGTVLGKKWAITNDGTNLYVAVGHKVYRKSSETEDYSLVSTLSDGDRVSKLMHNQRNGHVWIFYGNTSDDSSQNLYGAGKLRRFVVSSSTLSSEITLNSTTDMTRHTSIDVVDYNYSGSAYKYGVVYTDGDWNTQAGRLRLVDGSTLTVTTVASGSQFGFAGNSLSTINSNFLFTRNNYEVWFKGVLGVGSADKLCRVRINSGSGNWVSDGVILSGLDPYNVAAYSPVDDRVYYWGDLQSVWSHSVSSSVTTTNLIDCPVSSVVDSMVYSNGKVFFTLWSSDPYVEQRYYYLYSFSDNEAHNFQNYAEVSNKVHSLYSAMTYMNGILYGVDKFGRLYQYGTTLKSYAGEADFNGENVTNALNKSLQSFNLIGNISSGKNAVVYRRGDQTGIPQTSGNTLSLSQDDITSIGVENLSHQKADLVEVSNGNDTYTFDGNKYNSKVLSDARTISLSNELIPDEIVQDVCYYMYQFFKTDRSLYKIDLGILPLFQYETVDNANFNVANRRLAKAIAGDGYPIYTVAYKKDGSMSIEVLV